MLRWKDYYEGEELRRPERDSDTAHMEYLSVVALAPALVVWGGYGEQAADETPTASGSSWSDSLAWLGQRLIIWGERLRGSSPGQVAGDALGVEGNTPG